MDQLAKIAVERELRDAALRPSEKPAGYAQASAITRRSWDIAEEARLAKAQASLDRQAPAKAGQPQRPQNYDALSPLEKRMVQLAEQRKAGK